MLYTRRDSIKNKRPSRKSLSSELSKQESTAPGLSKSLSMASFELVSKAGDGSSDSALWLKELDAAIGAEQIVQYAHRVAVSLKQLPTLTLVCG